MGQMLALERLQQFSANSFMYCRLQSCNLAHLLSKKSTDCLRQAQFMFSPLQTPFSERSSLMQKNTLSIFFMWLIQSWSSLKFQVVFSFLYRFNRKLILTWQVEIFQNIFFSLTRFLIPLTMPLDLFRFPKMSTMMSSPNETSPHCITLLSVVRALILQNWDWRVSQGPVAVSRSSMKLTLKRSPKHVPKCFPATTSSGEQYVAHDDSEALAAERAYTEMLEGSFTNIEPDSHVSRQNTSFLKVPCIAVSVWIRSLAYKNSVGNEIDPGDP